MTLMEVMVTMAIVSIGILGVTSMNIQSAQAVQDAAEISLATNLATATLDEIQLQDYLDFTVGSISDLPVYYDKYGRQVAPSATNRFFTVNGEVELVSGDGLYKDVLITVSWNESTNQRRGRSVQIRGRIRQLARGV
ncbi:MAG: prepilin-type N-terminal cleavage/methylation domain-containing protein [Myxococcota bacterium]